MLGDKLIHSKLHEVVADRLTQAIIAGKFRVGDRLPPERDLTEQFGVSRGVIREATKLLVAKGLVVVRPGTGVTVVDSDGNNITESLSLFLHRQPAGLQSLLELRRCMEVEVAGLAAERATDADITTLENTLRRMHQASESGETEIFITVDLEFHRQIAEISKNILFVAILDSLGDVLLATRRVSVQVENGQQVALEGHRHIYEAIAHHDCSAARTSMQTHLEQTSVDIETVMQRQAEQSH